MTSNPVISVVIPTFNRADAIGLTLQHLAQQTLSPDRYEVIVVDDGSTDNTEQIVTSSQWPFKLRYLKQPNKGAAATRNLGVSQAQADIILFLDADVVPEPQLLQAHRETHRTNGLCLVVGRIRPWLDTSRPWYERIVNPEKLGMDYGDALRILPFYMALGGNLSLSRETFFEVGGYDESFPAAGCEETEFAYRAELRGYRLLYEPRAVGYHNHPRSLQQRCRQQAAHMRSMALLIVKHPELQTRILGVDELMPALSPPCSVGRFWRRVRASFFAFPPVRTSLYYALLWLDHQQRYPRLASILFWRLMTGWRYAGFREGLKLYGRPD